MSPPGPTQLCLSRTPAWPTPAAPGSGPLGTLGWGSVQQVPGAPPGPLPTRGLAWCGVWAGRETPRIPVDDREAGSGDPPQLRPTELRTPVSEHRGGGSAACTRAPTNGGRVRLGRRPRGRPVGVAGRVAWGSPRSPVCSGGRPSFPPLLLPAFLSFLLLEISLEKLSTVFLPEKKRLRVWATGPQLVRRGSAPVAAAAAVALPPSCFSPRLDTTPRVPPPSLLRAPQRSGSLLDGTMAGA